MSVFHYIYKITNIIDGKIYIGKHSTDDMEDGYMGSGKLLNRAIKKHGIENFRKRIIETFDAEEEALAYERKLVDEAFVADENTYNLTLGGRSQLSSQCRGMQNSQYGTCWIFNDDLKISKKIRHADVESAVLDGWSRGRRMYSLSDEARIKMGASWTKKRIRTHSIETRQKLSAISKGRRHSDETRQLLSSLQTQHVRATTSARFATTRWIHHPETNEHMRVQINELSNWIQQGWKLGRTMGGGSRQKLPV